MEIDYAFFIDSFQDFRQHLEIEGNERIVFSARYGMGKTTFIDHFFNKENQTKFWSKEKYNVFHLYPVNYSVASNEDIIRLLKYDIIYSLMEKEVDFEKSDFNYPTELKKFIGKNIHKILSPFLLLLPLVGKEVFGLYEKLDKLKEEFLDVAGNAPDEEKTFMEYASDETVRAGSIYENDVVTILIENVLKRLKSNGKENILILDDLDRLDPAHIFRLFNVFAAHVDLHKPVGKKNKFGFDKVIFVCDLDNIKDLFHHTYGNKINFSGYIDKFYSKNVYTFNNRDSIRKRTRNLLDNIKYAVADNYTTNFLANYIYQNSDVNYLLETFIRVNAISFRSLIRFVNERHEIARKEVQFHGLHHIYNYSLPFIAQLDFLKNLFGHYSHLVDAVEKCIERNIVDNDVLRSFGPILILDSQKHHFNPNPFTQNRNHKGHYATPYGLTYTYKLEIDDSIYKVTEPKFLSSPGAVGSEYVSNNHFFELMRDSILYLSTIGYFQ